MSNNDKIIAVRVGYDKLPEALEAMQGNHETWCRSCIDDVRLFRTHAIVIVRMSASYPYLEDKWKENFSAFAVGDYANEVDKII